MRHSAKIEKDVIDSIKFGIENIRRFHEEQRADTIWLKEIRPRRLRRRQLHCHRFRCALRAARKRRFPISDHDDMSSGCDCWSTKDSNRDTSDIRWFRRRRYAGRRPSCGGGGRL